MATRATVQEIAHLLPDLDLTVTDIQIFSQQATLVVDEELGTSGLSVARLKQIEMMLAAHYTIIAIENGGVKSIETLNAKETYATLPGKEGLASTRWGAQAVVLDTSGALGNLTSSERQAQFRVV